MKELVKNTYFLHQFDEEKKALYSYSFPETAYMTDEEYRENMQYTIEEMDEYQPNYILVDLSKMLFTITPDTQEWLQEKMFPCYERIPLKKLAFVVSEDFFAALSIEQTVENYTPAGYAIQYFKAVEEAKNWLFS